MLLRIAAALMFPLIAACAPETTSLEAITTRAEADATRAESAAAKAEASATRAFDSCYRANSTIIALRHSAEDLSDFCDRVTLGDDVVPEPPADADTADEDHAEAVMECHPELNSIPGFEFEIVDQNLTKQTKDGRGESTIVVTVEDVGIPDGAATLQKARALARKSVDGVPVKVVGVSEWNFRLMRSHPIVNRAADL